MPPDVVLTTVASAWAVGAASIVWVRRVPLAHPYRCPPRFLIHRVSIVHASQHSPTTTVSESGPLRTGHRSAVADFGTGSRCRMPVRRWPTTTITSADSASFHPGVPEYTRTRMDLPPQACRHLFSLWAGFHPQGKSGFHYLGGGGAGR